MIYESFKFVYKGKEYFLLTGKTYKLTVDELKKAKQTAKKQNKKLSQVIPYFCTQIACIKYNAGQEIDIKNCGRLVGVTYSNKKRTKFGRLNRVDIGLKDDSRIVIWKRRKSDSAVQVSTFAFDNKIDYVIVSELFSTYVFSGTISDDDIRKRLAEYKLGLLKMTKLTKSIKTFVQDTYKKYKAEGE